MIKEDKGQVSLEYLLIFAVSIILLIAFTLPLAEIGLEKTLDVSNTMNAKGELSKLSNAVSQVYGEGQGSKQTIYMDLDKSINVKITNSYLYASYMMNFIIIQILTPEVYFWIRVKIKSLLNGRLIVNI